MHTQEELREELWSTIQEHGEADAALINKIIFWDAPTNEPRGYRDVFTDAEIRKIASLECVYTQWNKHERDWLVATMDAIYQEEER